MARAFHVRAFVFFRLITGLMPTVAMFLETSTFFDCSNFEAPLYPALTTHL